jgi:hypothetical protein
LTDIEINNDYQDLYSYYKEDDTSKYIIYIFDNIDYLQNKNLKYLDHACGTIK